jgi:hypothetical protein
MHNSLADEIIYGNKQSVKTFIERFHPDLSEIDEYGYVPIIEAAICDKPGIAHYLVSQGADVNQKDMTGRTALHWATDNNNYDFCQFLLQQNINPNAYTIASQPALVNPLVRGHKKLTDLLVHHGANLDFAKDYVNGKMLGHVFNLQGAVDIVNANNVLVELGYEGFFLEFTLYAIREALAGYMHHYSARQFQPIFGYLRPILRTLTNAAKLIKFQQYNFDKRPYEQTIKEMLNRDLLLLPVAYDGHAISFVKFGDIWIRIDRGEYGREHGCINVYRIPDTSLVTQQFLYDLLYTKQHTQFITKELDQYLNLIPLTQIPIAEQITGNCSWANIEASIPSMLFLLYAYNNKEMREEEMKKRSLHFYEHWITWYQDKLLSDCIDSFHDAKSMARKASKAATLGSVLLQQSHYENFQNVERVNKMLKEITIPQFHYIMASYLKAYCYPKMTPGGRNLINLLESCGVDPDSLL